jgi:tetratricopeptide (TPR) repeat protein
MVGDLDGARTRLAELDAAAGAGTGGPDARRRRNRVLRELVEHSLRQENLTFDALTALLAGYRDDPMLSPADELWAIARHAELRLEAGQPRDAVDRLLIDMRRFEPRLAQNPGLGFGELYVLIARGYYDLGDHDYARYHANRALGELDDGSPIRGDALTLLGQLDIAGGDWEQAFERFDEVVRNFPGTHSFLPGLLGRAETLSILGDPERSLEDYRRLRDRLGSAGPRRDVTRERVARSLGDRHDAALTAGRLEDALAYVGLAETLFDRGAVPPTTLLRIASTSRQLADNLITAARREKEPTRPDNVPMAAIDPTLLAEASAHYRRAADYYVRHARSLAGHTTDDDAWAASLWLGADSHDLAGYHDEAITHFSEYLSGRSDADPMRSEASFRLAQAHQAQMDYESAAQHYQQVIDDHPRSHVASRSRVPLARSLIALDRREEAEQNLLQVVLGQRHLGPDAVDYRDALVELGKSYYDGGRYIKAIERLEEALQRYPDDAEILQVRFRLADSYRRRGGEIAEELADPSLLPSRRHELDQLRNDHLLRALDLFGQVADTRPRMLSGRPDSVQHQLVRYAGLYRADCLYELGRYEKAITLYDEVAGRYPRHHASLTALIQIVNCYSRLGDTANLDAAHHRALARLRELPDEAFTAPDALLDRAAWERWLQNIPLAAAPTETNVQ